jgi:hypothetical protein
MKTIKNGPVLAAVAVCAMTLSACGGGGGGGGGSKDADIAGSAVKGLVRNADVAVFELAAKTFSTAQAKQVGTGTTNANGAFSLRTSGYAGGAVLLQIKGRSSGTQVRCDALPSQIEQVCGVGKSRGNFIDVGPEFLLESYLPALSRGSNRINASALTQLLGALASSKLATLNTSQALTQALSQVRSLAGGVDVVGTTPVDIVTPPANATGEQLAYAALNAAVLSLADPEAATPQQAIQSAVQKLADEFKDGSIEKGKLAGLVEVAKQQLVAAEVADTAGVLAALDAATQGDPDETFAPTPVSPAASTAIGAAKAFVGNLRNTAQRYEDVLQPDEATDAYLAGLEEAAGLGEPKAVALFESLGLVVEEAGILINSGQASGSRTLSTQGSNGAKTATVTMTSSGGVTTLTATGNVHDDSVNLTFKLPTEQIEATGSTLSVSLAGSAETVGAGGARLTIADTSKAVITLRNGAEPVLSDEEIEGDFTGENIGQVVFDLDATLLQKDSKALSFQGVIGATVLRCDAAGTVCQTPVGEPRAFAPTRVSLKGVVRDGANNEVNASIGVAIPLASARKFNYANPYSASNFLEGTVTISSRVKLPASAAPETTVTVAVESKGWHNATEVPIGKVTVTFAEGSTVLLTASSENSATKPEPTVVTLTGAAGVMLILVNQADPDEDINLTGSILTVNGIKAGEVRQNGGLVTLHYDDGTFETLFN